jgi:WD40 repeat protein
LKGHTGSIKLISFSPSGELLLSASEDQTVRVWNASTGEPLPTVFTGYTGYYSAIAISPDWTKLATGRDNFTIRITDITSTAQGDPEPDRTPHGPFFENPKGSYRDIVTPLIFTHEGFTAITRSEKNLAFWRLAEAGKEPTVISHPLSQSYGCMVASPSSNHLILTNSREFGIWQTETGEPRGPNIKLASPSFIASVACSTNHLIALGCQDRTIRLWDFEAQIEIAQLSSRNEPRGLAFSADGRRLAASTYGRFEIWSIESHNLLHSFEHWPDVDYDPLVSSPEGKYVAVKVACDLFVYSIDHPSQPTRLKTSCMEGNPPLISADGHYLVDGSSVWELEVELFPGISISTPSPGFPRLLREYGTSSLYQELGPLLSLHEDGWIHSAHPAGRLLPVTQEWLGPLRYWRAHGGKVAILGLSGTIIIDCSPLLT